MGLVCYSPALPPSCLCHMITMWGHCSLHEQTHSGQHAFPIMMDYVLCTCELNGCFPLKLLPSGVCHGSERMSHGYSMVEISSLARHSKRLVINNNEIWTRHSGPCQWSQELGGSKRRNINPGRDWAMHPDISQGLEAGLIGRTLAWPELDPWYQNIWIELYTSWTFQLSFCWLPVTKNHRNNERLG